MVTDPVCGSGVNPQDTEGRSEKEGEMYYFCSLDRRESFAQDPDAYIDS